MNLSTTILGSTAVKHLQATSSAWVLQVGSDRLTRGELAGVGCYNFLAAKNLSAILQEFSVKSLADLYARIPPTALALPHMGVISLAVLGAAFEAKRIGGDTPLENWVKKHTDKDDTDATTMVSFYTLKRREHEEQRQQRLERRRQREERPTLRKTRKAKMNGNGN